MPTVYRPQMDLIRIDAAGARIPLASTTINVYNVTAAASLGTIASDTNGVVLQGSHTADVGDVIEYSHATYTGTGRHVLQATQLEAYEAADNWMTTLVLQNLQAGEVESRTVDIYALDLDQPKKAPVWVGRGRPGETVEFPYQTNIAKNMRFFPVSTDNANRTIEQTFDGANYVDLAVPATGGGVGEAGATLLWSHTGDKPSVAGTAMDLYSESVPANTLARPGDRLRLKVFLATDAGSGERHIAFKFNGNNLLSDDWADDNNAKIEITSEIVRRGNDTIDHITSAHNQFTSLGAVQGSFGSISFTGAIPVVLDVTTDGAADFTAKGFYAEYLPLPVIALSEFEFWAAYEARSYDQSDGTNITTNWTDLSGNARHATVSGTPTYETNEVNGEPVIRFGADSNDYFTMPSMSALTSGAWYFVWKVTDTSTNGSNRLGTGSAGHYPFSSDGKIYDQSGTNTRKDEIITYVTLSSVWHVMSGHSAASDWAMKQNGVVIRSTGTNTVAFSTDPYIGFNGSTGYMKMDLAACYFFGSKPAAAVDARMLAYIRQEWGVG